MKKPDFSKCTEEELWKYVGYHLSKAGIDSVLVGGAVVAIYSKGAYRSGDLDFVAGAETRPKIQEVLETLGFQSVRSRHFEHPDCLHSLQCMRVPGSSRPGCPKSTVRFRSCSQMVHFRGRKRGFREIQGKSQSVLAIAKRLLRSARELFALKSTVLYKTQSFSGLCTR